MTETQLDIFADPEKNVINILWVDSGKTHEQVTQLDPTAAEQQALSMLRTASDGDRARHVSFRLGDLPEMTWPASDLEMLAMTIIRTVRLLQRKKKECEDN